VEDSVAKSDPLDHKLVPELLPSYLEELAAVQARHANLNAQIQAAVSSGGEDADGPPDEADALSPTELAALKKQLAAVRKQQKIMNHELITELGKARVELAAAQERDLVLRLAKNDVRLHLDGYVVAHRQQIVAALENWSDKYVISLHQIEAERAATVAKLTGFLQELGYE